MEFLAALIAIVAIILALNIRKRVTLLEAHVSMLNGRLELRAADAARVSQAATQASSPEEPVIAPKPEASEPLSSSPPAEKLDEAAIDAVFAAAAQHAAAASPPPAELAAPSRSFEERFGASWVVWIGGLALALGGIFMVQYSI